MMIHTTTSNVESRGSILSNSGLGSMFIVDVCLSGGLSIYTLKNNQNFDQKKNVKENK